MNPPLVELSALMVSRGGSVDPRKHPDETFELLSIPAYDRGLPDVVAGESIGSTKQVVQPGDVLLSKIVPHIRRAWVVPPRNSHRQIASGEWIVFRNDEIHGPYFRQLLVSDTFNSQFMQTVAGVGGSLLRARPAHVAKIEVPLPPLDEQRRIAAILDGADELRTKRREAIAHLDALAQSIYDDMFGEQNFQPALLLENCEIIVDCVNKTAPVVDHATPFKMIRTTNVRNGQVNLDETRFVTEEVFNKWNSRARPRRGDVILTREAPMGEAGILQSDEKVFLGQRTILYRPYPSRLTAEFLLHSFRSDLMQREFTKYGSGSTVKHLSVPYCRDLAIPTPPIAMQRLFASRIAAVERLKDRHRSQLAELDSLFASLQHRAFKGEL